MGMQLLVEPDLMTDEEVDDYLERVCAAHLDISAEEFTKKWADDFSHRLREPSVMLVAALFRGTGKL